MAELLRIDGLVKQYGAICVTDHVNLTVNQGEIHALIGPNGAGKTTLINLVTGEVSGDAGAIYFAGRDITRWSVAKRARAGMSRSFQINSLIPAFTARENVLLAVQAARGHNFYFFSPVASDRALVDEADEFLVRVGLADQANELVSELAYGQQRLIEVAIAMASHPKLLLLDEPMAGLGPAESERMIALLDSLRQDYGMLLVEHDMDAVFALANRVSVLVYGQILLCDTPERVRQSDIVREAYLGDEEFDD
ncbi:MAG: ABC transporter ATP-binding protein [Burkholderiaceae bacterium]|nr:ABC transporter ATP-binding protein [Burkholderiaceae bacterium]MCD8517035.1 ABC transporter ATP-binding protein [Burkholderiaceae bacterium]MCD8536919.1 ABC transporter ATP-binding protein [Burkholderiaceae bacterium]MCD8566055.1 ABC transporter ATP-binding protein [Burkholderiaceae bacterium]